MAQTEGQDHLTEPTRIRRSIVWRLKVRLQFTGWLQYLLTALPAAVLLACAFIGWLIGRWSLALFWLPLAVAVLLLAVTLFDIVTVKWDLRPREPLPPRRDDLATFELIRSRTSCRSYQSRDLTPEDRAELADVIDLWTEPERLIGNSPIRLEYVAAPLTVWPTVGAHEFIVAIAPRDYDRTAIIDVGRSLQHVVLHATKMGVATCWIGPGADQSSVIAHLGDHFDIDRDHVVCVCAVGYRSRFQPLMIRAMGLLTHRRLPLSALFFADPDFRRPLAVDAPPFTSFGRCYEVCQWSPSSYNSQTTRMRGGGTEPRGGCAVRLLRFHHVDVLRTGGAGNLVCELGRGMHIVGNAWACRDPERARAGGRQFRCSTPVRRELDSRFRYLGLDFSGSVQTSDGDARDDAR